MTTNILDQVIANTNPARIVSQQHDTSKITVNQNDIDGGLRNMLGIWDAAEMGISKEEIERRIREADTPEARAQILDDLRQRALRRASLDTSNGRVSMMAAGKLPWHGLGVLIDKACNSAEAIEFSGLNWTVEKVPMQWSWDGQEHTADDVFALVRTDTGEKLGTVGSRYKVIQNRDGFGYLDSVLNEFGAKYETAGSIYGGSVVWMLAHLPEQRFAVNGTDACEPYVVFTNPHDGKSGKAYCYPTEVRVECANTLRVSGTKKHNGLGIRHTGDIESKIKDAQRALGLAVQEFDEFKETAQAMATVKTEPLQYFDGILDHVLDITHAEMTQGADALTAVLKVTEAEREVERKRIQKQIDNRQAMFQDMLDRYESERCGKAGRGTLWASFNAVTESADHGKLGGRHRGSDKSSRHFESVLNGRADEVKQVAYTMATNLTR